MELEKKYFAGWWLWLIFLIIIAALIGSILKYTGMIGTTIVERVIFENSFQYKEGMKQRSSVLESSLSEIDLMQIQGKISILESEAQKRVLRIQLGSVK